MAPRASVPDSRHTNLKIIFNVLFVYDNTKALKDLLAK